MLNVIKKDITDVTSGIIAHQVNCTNHIGSGVAKAIITKWPIVKVKYHEWCNLRTPDELIGTIQLISISDDLIVANCFSQRDKGYDGKLYTDYSSIRKCLGSLSKLKLSPLYIPYKMGCGLGGGNWNIVCDILIEVCPEVIICAI